MVAQEPQVLLRAQPRMRLGRRQPTVSNPSDTTAISASAHDVLSRASKHSSADTDTAAEKPGSPYQHHEGIKYTNDKTADNAAAMVAKVAPTSDDTNVRHATPSQLAFMPTRSARSLVA